MILHKMLLLFTLLLGSAIDLLAIFISALVMYISTKLETNNALLPQVCGKTNASKNIGANINKTVTHAPEISFLCPDLPEKVRERNILQSFQSLRS